MLPTFLVIGAQKAATSAIWSLLDQHPQIFIPALKETNYFLVGGPGRWQKGRAWYESLYEPGGEVAQRGDVSPGYSMFPHFRGVPERGSELLPGARIIYSIREPVERMVSAWAQTVEDGLEYRGVREALVWGSNYILPSFYGMQLKRWADHFPAEALLVVRSEDLAADPGTTIDRMLVHLGLAPGWRPAAPGARVNRAEEKLLARGAARRVAGGLRGAGFRRAAIRLTRNTPATRRLRLVRPIAPQERTLEPEVEAALRECLREDFALLRRLVGPELDLYGLA